MDPFILFHGVIMIEKNKYLASISYCGINKRLGPFVTAKQAAKAYDIEVLRIGLEDTLPLNRDSLETQS